ncbi:MAG: hypothetical protein ACXW06_06740 [Halobacteriota archaeon]
MCTRLTMVDPMLHCLCKERVFDLFSSHGIKLDDASANVSYAAAAALGAFGHKNAPAKALRRSILIGSSGAVCAVAIPLK